MACFRLARIICTLALIMIFSGGTVVAQSLEITKHDDMSGSSQKILAGEKNLQLAVYKIKVVSDPAYIKKMVFHYEGKIPADEVFEKATIDNAASAVITKDTLIFDLEKMQSSFWAYKGEVTVRVNVDVRKGLSAGTRFRIVPKSVEAFSQKAEPVTVAFDPVELYSVYFVVLNFKNGLLFEKRMTVYSMPSPYEQYLLASFRVAAGFGEDVWLQKLLLGFLQSGDFKIKKIQLMYQTNGGTETIWEGSPSPDGLVIDLKTPALINATLDEVEQFQLLFSTENFDENDHLILGLSAPDVQAEGAASEKTIVPENIYNLPMRFKF